MKTNINIFNIPDTLQLEELLDVKGGTGDNNKLCAVIGAGVKCTVAGSGACTVSGSGFCTVEGSGIRDVSMLQKYKLV